jgi:hypothetical protein
MRQSVLSVALWIVCGAASAQTILYDFEDGAQGWGSFGAITTDSGEKLGSVGLGRYHTADFSVTDVGNFGIVDVSPPDLDLSPYGGLAVDARFVDVPGFEPFVGVKELDIIVATGEGATENEFFAPKVTMTDEFQTFSAPFSSFRSALNGLAPTQADLAAIRIKLVVLNANGVGTAELNYDEVTGLPKTQVDSADFDSDGDVDGADFVVWQRGLNNGANPAEGDADNNGVVNAGDLAIWRNQFGAPPGAGAVISAVPEPAAAMLALLAAAALGNARRSNAERLAA